jgi:tol-pal system protein YbgF
MMPGQTYGPAPPFSTDPNAQALVAPGASGTLPGAAGLDPNSIEGPGPPQAIPSGPPPTSAADEAAQEANYRTAYNDFNRGDFENARMGFQEFLRRYPSSPLAGRAQYFIGESLFSQQRYSQAAESFTRVIENYPGSDKTAAAYLKKGLSLLALKQTARGVMQLQHIIETYPRSEEARVAADQLRQLGLRDR